MFFLFESVQGLRSFRKVRVKFSKAWTESNATLMMFSTQEEHEQRLEAVVQRLPDANVTLNAKKHVFNVLSVNCLGQIVGSDGIQSDPEKIQAIIDMPHPTNPHEVRSFLGMVNQISKFISNLADITKPIREMLVKNIAWTWGTTTGCFSQN